MIDDDGPGIREDALERIFERFYTDRPHQGFGQNSGLGLSISKQIIEAHGGRIWAENCTGPLGADGETSVAGARLWSGCPPHDECRKRPRFRSAGGSARRADQGTVRHRQIAAGVRSHPGWAFGADRAAVLIGDTRHLRPATGNYWSVQPANWPA